MCDIRLSRELQDMLIGLMQLVHNEDLPTTPHCADVCMYQCRTICFNLDRSIRHRGIMSIRVAAGSVHHSHQKRKHAKNNMHNVRHRRHMRVLLTCMSGLQINIAAQLTAFDAVV